MSIETIVGNKNHIQHNGLAGLDATKLKNLRNSQLRSCFQRLNENHFRMEFVAKIRESEFYNDAMARNVNATWYTLNTLNGPLVWIAMGSTKATNYSLLQKLAADKVKVLICVGDHTDQLQEQFEGIVPVIETAYTIEEAVHKAFYNSLDVQKILFSPTIDAGTQNETLGKRYNSEINEL